ncbi:DUF881 domain-containing protein [Pseudokineococcus marinus]|uniref:DUF881 domain-containing protein n=1 Tax=Pseudokineococcus marinus TaxID=351215 RepID=A0A849BNV0_9ACTN|nr:DUF881 domain-containing protein [Pseudokineococcus marinus]NNH22502.1 DUF881 domain-containing protein [Pseudokineococcus marinus]
MGERAREGRRRGSRARSRAGTAAVTAVLCLAGLLFATSADTADGTDLRQEDEDLRAVVADESHRVAVLEERVSALRAGVEELSGDEVPGAGSAAADALAVASQTAPAAGEGLVVVLADAPRETSLAPGYALQDTVVHSQDVQAVVNALWQGGAEAMGVMDQRVIATTAVRCVGSTLRVQGRYYPPPYRIEAVGDPEELRAALESSAQVQLYRAAARDLGLVYDVSEDDLELPAYGGSLRMSYASVPPSA